jgi:fructokinase
VFAIGPEGAVERPGPTVEVVDTVGAGDAFTAGLLARLRDRGQLTRPGLGRLAAADLADALDHAQRVAAFTCTRVGADPPWWHELT